MNESKFASMLAGIIVAVIALAGIAVTLAIPVIIWAWILTL